MQQVTQFTYSGHMQAEITVANILSSIVTEITQALEISQIKALVLLGGYGKGEGGIQVKAGRYRPHNNFDLLLVTEALNTKVHRQVNEIVQRQVQDLEKQLHIGIDISVMPEAKLRCMPTRVLWYDMKLGHKTLYGDQNFIPSINHKAEDIPAWDMRNLMVNRGSLLLINQLCLQRLAFHPLNKDALKKLIIKHTMKAVIGYGDALLYFSGEYHWSYIVKQFRVSNCSLASTNFKCLYQEAMAFRFTPDYARYRDVDFLSWQARVMNLLGDTHLQCERLRLGDEELEWQDYLSAALKQLPLETAIDNRSRLKTLIKAMQNVFVSHPGNLPANTGLKTRAGYYTSSQESLLPLLFPLIAFAFKQQHLRPNDLTFLRSHLQLNDDNSCQLIGAYLQQWGRYFDVNLCSVLKKHGIHL
ncbi:MAG: hypothetical protein HRU20_23510 [Pseudomonadales bacterium]|nr:hypothetical protein [Pseudomonadales bacterium]